MTERPVLLMYNIDPIRRSKILPNAARMRIVCRVVRAEEFELPVGELLSSLEQKNIQPGNTFTDPMLVMAGFSSGMMNAFLNALRVSRMPPVGLKAVLTPTNETWSSVKLHDEIQKEHLAMKRKG